MKKILIVCFLIMSIAAFAQKEELKVLTSNYEQLFKKNEAYHLSYTLTVASSLDTTVQRMKFDLYKSGNKDRMEMGDAQVMIHDGTFFILINNEAHMIRMSNDSSNVTNQNILVSSFTSIIDSSNSVLYSSKEGKLNYTLLFPSSYVYSKVELVFSKKTKSLIRIYALFSEEYPSEFKYLEVDYLEPNFKWVPNANFPGTDEYVMKSNGRYILQEAFDSYKTY